MNIILKQYARFPQFLALPCYFEHGWTPYTHAMPNELKTDKPLMLVVSQRRAKVWKSKSKIPVAIMGEPFILYKNTHKLSPRKDAKGTVVFPSHSTYDVESQYPIEEYCRELKRLPKKFQPVTICLFWLDYIDKTADIYRQMGFRVVTAGPKLVNSLEFVKNFYDILSKHKFSTSNDVGSYTFYAIDFGVPFFLTGKGATIVNSGRRDINIPKSIQLDNTEYGKKAIKVFSTGPTERITDVQKRFVDEENGASSLLSRSEMNKLLWKYFRDNNYWVRTFVPYLFSSLFSLIIFNGPWIKFLTSVRRKITK